jgi:tetratricopeptide (TPR) repeat protein/DNA-binding CsgD family transcriptional regulator
VISLVQIILVASGFFQSAPTSSAIADTLEINLSQSKGIARAKLFNQYTSALLDADPEKAMDVGKRAVQFCEGLNDKRELAIAYGNMGVLYYKYDQEHAGNELLMKSLSVALEQEDYMQASFAAFEAGTGFYKQDNIPVALFYYLKSLEYAEKINDERSKAKAFSGISVVYTDDGRLDEALDISLKALNVFERLNETKDISRMHDVIARIYYRKKEYDKALDYYSKAILLWEKEGRKMDMAISYLNVGDVYRRQKQWDMAEQNLLRCLEITRTQDADLLTEARCRVILGEVEEGKGDLDNSLQYYLQAVDLSKKAGAKKLLSKVYHDLSDLYEKKGDYKVALQYHDLHVIYYDSVFSAEKAKMIKELEARFENSQKEKEIELLKKSQTITQVYWIAGVSVAFFIIVIVFLVVNRQRLQAKKDAMLSLQEKKLLEADLHNRKLMQDQLQEKIDFNNRSLTAYTLNLIHKNEMLEDIKAQVEGMRRLPDSELQGRLQLLLKSVSYSIHLDKDWENFKFHFEQVHQGFFDNLKHTYPELTMNDLFLSSLIRLNLETKQIATLMDISADSAKVFRSRLRKKLNLATDQNLVEFLNTF